MTYEPKADRLDLSGLASGEFLPLGHISQGAITERFIHAGHSLFPGSARGGSNLYLSESRELDVASIGVSGPLRPRSRDKLTRMRISVIGVPMNSAGTKGGVAGAPEALREAGLLERLTVSDVRDEGDVRFEAPSPERDPASGLIAPRAIASMFTGVEKTVRDAIVAGRFPLVLGGDCPLLLGCLAGARSATGRSVGLLFVDGHEDAWPPLASTTGEAADMELGLALGRNTASLPPMLTDRLPLVETQEVVVLGARDLRELDGAGVGSIGDRIELHDDEAVRVAGPGLLARSSAQRLHQQAGTWWLHVDLDVLSTAEFPAVDYPQPGGLSWSELRELTEAAISVAGLAGWDVTIYNPDLDTGGTNAGRIVDYVAACLATD